MNEIKKGTKLWDSYFRVVVVVEKSGTWTDPRYITGRYYTVRFADGTLLDSHETSFTRPWLRKRLNNGKFKKEII